MDDLQIITLKPQNWAMYKELRLRALKEEPQAYGATYEENAKKIDESWMQKLEKVINEKT